MKNSEFFGFFNFFPKFKNFSKFSEFLNSKNRLILYCYLGQELDASLVEKAKTIDENASIEEKLLTKYRKFVAFFIPFSISQAN